MTDHHSMADTASTHHHGTVKSYIVGFALSLTITFIVFALVSYHMLSHRDLYIAVTVLAIMQLLVQLVFFLHLSTRSEARWNLLAFLFTVLVIAILAGGSLWIMYSLDYYMVH